MVGIDPATRRAVTEVPRIALDLGRRLRPRSVEMDVVVDVDGLVVAGLRHERATGIDLHVEHGAGFQLSVAHAENSSVAAWRRVRVADVGGPGQRSGRHAAAVAEVEGIGERQIARVRATDLERRGQGGHP